MQNPMTAKLLQDQFDAVDELAGTYPDSDSLRNAVLAVIEPNILLEPQRLSDRNPKNRDAFLRKVERVAREYEQARGISMTIGTRS